MKCKICGRKTNWDSSFGYREFIVCPHCFFELQQDFDCNTLELVFKLGQLVRDRNKEKEMKRGK